MKVSFIGDFYSNDGVANANKNIRKGIIEANLEKEFLFSKETAKVKRIIETIKMINRSQAVCFSGITKVNLLIIIYAKIRRRSLYYILHGYPYFEQKIESVFGKKQLMKIRLSEMLKFLSVERVICVSKICKEFMEDEFPWMKNKFVFVDLAADLVDVSKSKIIRKDPNMVTTIGGGRRIKNINSVAKAITKLNVEGIPLKLYVIGSDGPDSDLLKQYRCVNYIGKISYDKAMDFLQKSSIYVQNSYFETFGLAVIEALIRGNSLVLTKNIGANDVLDTVCSSDLIDDNQDVDEIARKIRNVYIKGNNNRLMRGLDKSKINPKNVAQKLFKILT